MTSEQDIGQDQEWKEAGLMPEADGDDEPVTDELMIDELEKGGSA